MKKLSMKDIAEYAGVSVATVSRVINGNGRFSEETRQKVNNIIEEYNYTPSNVARALRTQKMPCIAIIVPDITNEFFAKLVMLIEEKLMTLTYTTMICNTHESAAIEAKFIPMINALNISGLIYIAEGEGGNPVVRKDLPVVYIDRISNDVEENIFIASDNFLGGYLAGERLIKAGCRRSLFIMDNRNISAFIDRQKGFTKAHADYNIKFSEQLICCANGVDFEAGKQEIEWLINSGILFDGIFCVSDMLAFGAYGELTSRGFSVPEDVKIIGFDDISISQYALKPLTTIQHNTELIAKNAVSTILKLVCGETVATKNIIIPVSLIERSTT